MFKPYSFFQNARKIINLRFKLEEKRGRFFKVPNVREHPAFQVLVVSLAITGIVSLSQYLWTGSGTRVEITTQANPQVQSKPTLLKEPIEIPEGSPTAPANLPVEAPPEPAVQPEEEVIEDKVSAGPDWTKSQQPIQGQVVSAFSFGYAEFFDDYRLHGGIDYAAPRGTPVTAVLGGTVEAIYDHGLYGKMITVDHGDGWQSHYAPVQDVEVIPGQWVAAGTQLGRLAAPPPAEQNQGTHLHFELHHHGEPLDPSLYIKK